MEFEFTVLFRVVIALLLSGIVGWERETAGQAAGLRTHMLVGAGAALFVGLGESLVRSFSDFGDLQQFDPTRVLEAVVAGVSFLGAGSIIFNRDNRRVRGLTTAASLWTTAGVGVASGSGRYVIAAGSALIIFVVLHGFRRFETSASENRAKPADQPPA